MHTHTSIVTTSLVPKLHPFTGRRIWHTLSHFLFCWLDSSRSCPCMYSYMDIKYYNDIWIPQFFFLGSPSTCACNVYQSLSSKGLGTSLVHSQQLCISHSLSQNPIIIMKNDGKLNYRLLFWAVTYISSLPIFIIRQNLAFDEHTCTCIGRVALFPGHSPEFFNVHVTVGKLGVAWVQNRALDQLIVAT